MAIPPEDFRCPISFELMSDPVILSSGQTYDRPFITRWLDAGHRTCPKTKQVLYDIKLIPNYALRSVIYHWAEANGINLKKPADSCPAVNSGYGIAERDSIAKLKTTVEDLMKSLTRSTVQARRNAISKIRELSRESKERRFCIVETGAISRIVPLLSCGDSYTEEIAVDALLEISRDDENKVGLVAEGAVDGIVNALKNGSMETRMKAAITLTSLAMVDVNKATIGRCSDAIPGLVNLLSEANMRAKKEAMNALCNLCMFPENTAKAVSAGVIPLLLALFNDGGSETIETSLAVLDFLSTSLEGKQFICRELVMPMLVRFLKTGTARSREHAAAVLCSLCMNNKKNTLQAFNAGARDSCLELMQQGTIRARRKASALMKAFQECVYM